MRSFLALRPLWVTHRHLRCVLPLVARELEHWERLAGAIPDPELRRQALASLRHKRFHCEGGSVFAAWEPGAAEALVRFIVAFQTVSDYLDNLCDRTHHLDPEGFRRLHRAMEDALTPKRKQRSDYYSAYPHRDDGGYLWALVEACRSETGAFPSWERVEAQALALLQRYIDLQVYKHVEARQRVRLLEEWFEVHRREHSRFYWWEFAAACGSTLGVFALAAEAARPRPVEALDRLVGAYFPWISGLHILLDYFIDQEEDQLEGDLNFVRFYPGPEEAAARMAWIAENAVREASALRDAGFHRTVVEGLLGLYLSDPKVWRQGLEERAGALVRKGGWRAVALHAYCRRWRKGKAAESGAYSDGITS